MGQSQLAACCILKNAQKDGEIAASNWGTTLTAYSLWHIAYRLYIQVLHALVLASNAFQGPWIDAKAVAVRGAVSQGHCHPPRRVLGCSRCFYMQIMSATSDLSYDLRFVWWLDFEKGFGGNGWLFGIGSSLKI